jgi:hypothetical protein
LFVRRNFCVLSYGVQSRVHPLMNPAHKAERQQLLLPMSHSTFSTSITAILAIPPRLPCNNCKLRIDCCCKDYKCALQQTLQ